VRKKGVGRSGGRIPSSPPIEKKGDSKVGYAKGGYVNTFTQDWIRTKSEKPKPQQITERFWPVSAAVLWGLEYVRTHWGLKCSPH